MNKQLWIKKNKSATIVHPTIVEPPLTPNVASSPAIKPTVSNPMWCHTYSKVYKVKINTYNKYIHIVLINPYHSSTPPILMDQPIICQHQYIKVISMNKHHILHLKYSLFTHKVQFLSIIYQVVILLVSIILIPGINMCNIYLFRIIGIKLKLGGLLCLFILLTKYLPKL